VSLHVLFIDFPLRGSLTVDAGLWIATHVEAVPVINLKLAIILSVKAISLPDDGQLLLSSVLAI
jgi:hypothetical protein